MSGTAFRRLMAEYRDLCQNPPHGVVAGPISEDKFLEWEALITGPEGTPYSGGCFTARLSFPPDYPLNPPKMRFITPMWHPNSYIPFSLKCSHFLLAFKDESKSMSLRLVLSVYPNGEVCISILHPPGEDPLRYEKSEERWSPVQSVSSILLSVISMLAGTLLLLLLLVVVLAHSIH